ncbi:hypothetical protein [Caenimonas koreensis]|uniref:Uncharacterized protein n=1 Tax=Caenimonas koreensis DSM 17982 TaxID=1121255 RepID=A0A844B797_9BURK|nr:hypothetical protein [Caenimonas koreensis]MRD49043.1 hypothetical protein [Caenimonas koreensis DSM 17982]
MRRFHLVAAAVFAAVVASFATACSPTFNWRDVNVEGTSLKAMLPCKPDKDSREVPMAGKPAMLEVLACDAGSAKFALLHADIGDVTRVGDALWQWRLATLANLRGAAARDAPFTPPGATPVPQAAKVSAIGQRADGSKVESQAAYFASGSHVFQAVIYADRITPEMTESFFAGLQLQ